MGHQGVVPKLASVSELPIIQGSARCVRSRSPLEWPDKESPPAEGHATSPQPTTVECGFCGRALEAAARECPVCGTPLGTGATAVALDSEVEESAPLRAWGAPSPQPAAHDTHSWPDKDEPSDEDPPASLLSPSKIRVALGLAACAAAVAGVAAYVL